MIQPTLSICLFGFVARASNISTTIPLTATAYGTAFDASVVFGNQTLVLQVDTGSSDTWVLGPSWQCHNGDNLTSVVSQAGSTFENATYIPDNSFKLKNGFWLGEQYGGGDVLGSSGYETLTLGSIVVPRQDIGVVNVTTTAGDTFNVGLLGLGYPALVRMHHSSYSITIARSGAANVSLLQDRVPYATVFRGLIDAGMEPYISLALKRTPLQQETSDVGGFLGLSTLPSVQHGPFVTVPGEVTQSVPLSSTNNAPELIYWTVTVQSFTQASDNSSISHHSAFQAVLDSSNPYLQFPASIAAELNAGFKPPATLASTGSSYSVMCSAIPPVVAIGIGNMTFQMNPRDMIWTDGSGAYYSSIVPSATLDNIEYNFLGNAFLSSVVAVLEMGRNEMKFAARTWRYQSNTTSSPTGSVGGATNLPPMVNAGTAVMKYRVLWVLSLAPALLGWI